MLCKQRWLNRKESFSVSCLTPVNIKDHNNTASDQGCAKSDQLFENEYFTFLGLSSDLSQSLYKLKQFCLNSVTTFIDRSSYFRFQTVMKPLSFWVFHVTMLSQNDLVSSTRDYAAVCE